MSETESVNVPMSILRETTIRSSVLKTLILGTTRDFWNLDDLTKESGISRAATGQHVSILRAAGFADQVNRLDWRFSFTRNR